ncbi:MAG: ADP-ribosylglycohydrolase [Pedobacter sp.]|jgi:ADP-ribosyl-[dinitrogen reductase] hydrolase|nr:ADP-ribosylglycohydrolase [Pedobacter sp.]
MHLLNDDHHQLAGIITDRKLQPKKDIYKDILLGVAVGDALGVPVEFCPRERLRMDPVTGMRGHGTYDVPAGSFSDDASLTLCLAEAMTKPFCLNELANKFVLWLYQGYWTANGHVFDVGDATKMAITDIKNGAIPESAGGKDEWHNGNGSLMRILPLLVLSKDLERDARFELTQQVSSLTHGHIRSIMACDYYLEYALGIINGEDKVDVYSRLQKEIRQYWLQKGIHLSEIQRFDALLSSDISIANEDVIESGGYVLHTLTASIWCLLTTNSYAVATLKAVNLGHDTDTTAAVTGGLAALIYGYNTIPADWLSELACREKIEELAIRMKAFNES